MIKKLKRWWSRIEWPWTKVNGRVDDLSEQITTVEKALTKARVANFIQIVAYTKSMDLSWQPLPPISLENLQERIDELEKKVHEITYKLECHMSM